MAQNSARLSWSSEEVDGKLKVRDSVLLPQPGRADTDVDGIAAAQQASHVGHDLKIWPERT